MGIDNVLNGKRKRKNSLKIRKMERLLKKKNVANGSVATTNNEMDQMLSYVIENCAVLCLS